MENIQNINIDIMNNKHSDYIYAKQYDNNRVVEFTITENGKPKTLDGTYCTFLMKGKEMLSFVNLVRDGDIYRLTITDNETHEAGKIPYQLVLSSGEVTIDSEGHIVWEEGSSIIGTVTSYAIIDKCVVDEDDIRTQFDDNILERLLAEVQTAEAVVDEIEMLTGYSEAYANNAYDSAIEAESWAKGGTESRTGEDTDNSKYYSKVSKSYAVGGTDILHDGEPDTRDNAKYYCEQAKNVYDTIHFITKVTLLATGEGSWHNENHTQSVTVPGVVADQDAQLIVVRPTYESMEEYAQCDVMCIEQLTDGLIFKWYNTRPTHDLEVYVSIQDLEFADKTKVSQFIISPTEPTSVQMSVDDFWIQPYE